LAWPGKAKSKKGSREGCFFLAAKNTRPQKSPAFEGGAFLLNQYKLDNLNFFSLHAFLTAGSDERNLLAFFQAFEAVGLDSFEV